MFPWNFFVSIAYIQFWLDKAMNTAYMTGENPFIWAYELKVRLDYVHYYIKRAQFTLRPGPDNKISDEWSRDDEVVEFGYVDEE